MPVTTLDRERFSKFVERKLTSAEMTKWLPWLGLDIEEVGEDHVKVEFNPNRIDFCSYAGVARAFKGLRSWKTGLPKYNVKDGRTVLNINEAVSEVRPFMLAAIVRDIKLDEEDVVDLMEMQEDLHWGIGRDRKKASIGVHNLDLVEPPFTFTAVKPNSVKFVPLDKTEEMTLKEILEKHEKGMAYKHLVDWAPKYPLLIDKDSKVLSMPPIINGELTRINEETENLFLDVTGTDYAAVEKSLNVLSTALADMGGTIERVKVKYSDHTVFSPDLSPKKMKLQTAYANELLGFRLFDSKIVECLEKCRLGAKKVGKGFVEVAIPAYRIDILHEVDLVEEVAIGYGYYKLKPTFPSSVTIGKQHLANKTANMARQIVIGLGFTEVMNFTLTNENLHYKKMRRKAEKPVKLANPVSSEYTIMRQDLLPSLMKNLADNKHESFPQRLFEISDVVRLNNKLETQCERRLHIAAVSSHATANFTKIKSAVEALMANMGLKRWKINATEHSSFIDGRAATIGVKNKQIGIVGEVHPEVLNNFELENPTAAFEINLEALID
ncbi:MAG: phenylalanine--tRNA ligase subunit beta [Candidatus Bathyarchaeota archaeon]|nr:phenylalanine--tRNA ligase subunit beta [Candidatus Bathyarchaeota archaeon]MDH5494109.1 phenylalanine--tRNA ligase subunit beta [Candidatus Bathyarchaeota archaeon]